MQRRIQITLVVTLVAGTTAGCGAAPTGTPRTGTWTYLEAEARADKCDLAQRLGNDGEFGIRNEGEGRITVYPWQAPTFECFVNDDDSYVCPEWFVGDLPNSYNVRIPMNSEIRGTFDTSQHTSGEHHVTVDCEGSRCAALEESSGVRYPCTMIVDYEARWLSPLL